ncbi:MAG: hypothetical protein GX797_07425 [Chloroflexi bacterium]|jgi:amidase|nr:hypothetical protein [Chloroflexota bacterium]
MKYIPKDCPKYYLDELDSPVAKIDSGEKICVDLYDTYTGQISSENILRNSIDHRRMTPLTGPVYINDSEPGDVLRVDIHEINVAPKGVMPLAHGMGTLGDQVDHISTKVFSVSAEKILFSKQIHLPLLPMIGTIGLAPAGDKVRAFTPGDFGGNMDFNGINPGCSIFFPISVPGGLLYLGDLHAIQGDGELSGTGLEIAGSVMLTTTVIRNLQLLRPVVYSNGTISFIASHRSLEKAITIAIDDSIAWLRKEFDLDFSDAYRLVSLVGNIRICQLVNPKVTVRLDISNNVLDFNSLFDGGAKKQNQ